MNELNEKSVAEIKPTVVEQAVLTLNEFLKGDPEACAALLAHRIPASQATIDHPSIICAEHKGKPAVGFLGVLNGILFAATDQKIASVHVDGDNLVGFQIYSPKPTKVTQLKQQ